MICRHCDTDVERDELPAHLVAEHHLRVCAPCAATGRTAEIESGHCCARCRTRLDDDLRDILRLAEDAAAWIVPATGAGGSRFVPASRPPLDVDAIDPECALVRLLPGDPSSDQTVLEVLESWERLIRDERGYAPYGPASLARNAAVLGREQATGRRNRVECYVDTPRDAEPAESPTETQVTLVGVIRFLRSQVDYATTEPTFSLNQFIHETALCRRALARWDHDREGDLPGVSIPCPTTADTGDCGYRLRVVDLGDHVHCPRCGATRSGGQLAHIAMTADDGVWLSAVDAARWLGISESTLRRRANAGRITRRAGRYLIRHERQQA